ATTKEGEHHSEGLFQSAKDSLTSAYNVVSSKVSETADIAKEKMGNMFHKDTSSTRVNKSEPKSTVIEVQRPRRNSESAEKNIGDASKQRRNSDALERFDQFYE